jgi:hypothetical protein
MAALAEGTTSGSRSMRHGTEVVQAPGRYHNRHQNEKEARHAA